MISVRPDRHGGLQRCVMDASPEITARGSLRNLRVNTCSLEPLSSSLRPLVETQDLCHHTAKSRRVLLPSRRFPSTLEVHFRTTLALRARQVIQHHNGLAYALRRFDTVRTTPKIVAMGMEMWLSMPEHPAITRPREVRTQLELAVLFSVHLPVEAGVGSWRHIARYRRCIFSRAAVVFIGGERMRYCFGVPLAAKGCCFFKKMIFLFACGYASRRLGVGGVVGGVAVTMASLPTCGRCRSSLLVPQQLVLTPRHMRDRRVKNRS